MKCHTHRKVEKYKRHYKCCSYNGSTDTRVLRVEGVIEVAVQHFHASIAAPTNVETLAPGMEDASLHLQTCFFETNISSMKWNAVDTSFQIIAILLLKIVNHIAVIIKPESTKLVFINQSEEVSDDTPDSAELRFLWMI